jgi:peptide/nickel transport system permease protein
MITLPLFGRDLVLLASDVLVWGTVFGGLIILYFGLRRAFWRKAMLKIVADGKAMWCLGWLVLLTTIVLVDSVHYRVDGDVRSALDAACSPFLDNPEQSYSTPMAHRAFTPQVVSTEAGPAEVRPTLIYGGRHFEGSEEDYRGYVFAKICGGLFRGFLVGLIPCALMLILCRRWELSRARTIGIAAFWISMGMAVVSVIYLSAEFHVLGTNKVGTSTLWIGLKSFRTAFIIGSLTTVIAAIPAVTFGILAGYLRGWVDDLVQYVYTTLSSIPNILLISAAMLIVQTQLANSASETVADQRLLFLCLVLGLSSWAGLCRLVRGEVLKLREIEYVQAATVMGVSKAKIMLRHLLPNVMHIILIDMVLGFSALILTEAVLAYIGIGVHPSTQSFGNMIVGAQEQLARTPAIWWNLLTAFLFLLILVIPANLFGDAVRDALDPKLEADI